MREGQQQNALLIVYLLTSPHLCPNHTALSLNPWAQNPRFKLNECAKDSKEIMSWLLSIYWPFHVCVQTMLPIPPPTHPTPIDQCVAPAVAVDIELGGQLGVLAHWLVQQLTSLLQTCIPLCCIETSAQWQWDYNAEYKTMWRSLYTDNYIFESIWQRLDTGFALCDSIAACSYNV